MIKLIDGNHQKKVPHAPTVDLKAGTAVLIGTTVTITSVDILAAGPAGAVNWPNGGARYSIPNGAGNAYDAGDDVFVDIANGEGLPAGGDGKIGTVTHDVAATDEIISFIHER